jgi:hypothetical protein
LFMSEQSPEPAPAQPSNVVYLFPPANTTSVDVLHAVSVQYEALRHLCLDLAAQRIEWLASGVALWPDALLTREHLLTQLRTLIDGIRELKGAHPQRPDPTGGAAA